MKAILRLPAGLCPDRELSVVSDQLSAICNQPLASSYYLPAKQWLIPKTYYLIFEKEISAVSNQQSELSRFILSIGKLIPKTQYLIPILLLVFVSCGAALAQDVAVKVTPAAKAETEITPLKIGDKIPDELWEMYFPILKTKSEEQQYVRLGEYKNQLLILDFWSIYCGSCIAGFPGIHHLNNQFADDAVILPVSFEQEERTQAFLDRRPEYKEFNLSFVQGNELLRAYFPFRYVPHEVWIGLDGTFLGATNSTQVNKESLMAYISQGITPNSTKADQMDFDKSKPLFVNGNGGTGDQYLYRSVFSDGIEGLPSMTGLDTSFSDVALRYYATNIDLKGLFLPVFPKVFFIRRNLVKYEMSDQRMKDKLFVYELTFSKERQTRWREMVRDDIGRYLGVEAELAKRTLDAYSMEVDFNVLNQMSKKATVLPVENGKSFRDIELRTLVYWLSTHPDFPPVLWEDPSDEIFNIDLEYDEWSVDSIIGELKRYGIELIPTQGEFEVFVIKDVV